MPFVKRSEIKIVSIIDDDEVDESKKTSVKKMSFDDKKNINNSDPKETSKSGS